MSQYKEGPTAEETAAPAPQADAPHDLEPGTEVQQLQAELEKLRAESGENLDRFLRARAEVENVRKRGEDARGLGPDPETAGQHFPQIRPDRGRPAGTEIRPGTASGHQHGRFRRS